MRVVDIRNRLLRVTENWSCFVWRKSNHKKFVDLAKVSRKWVFCDGLQWVFTFWTWWKINVWWCSPFTQIFFVESRDFVIAFRWWPIAAACIARRTLAFRTGDASGPRLTTTLFMNITSICLKPPSFKRGKNRTRKIWDGDYLGRRNFWDTRVLKLRIWSTC